MKFLVVVFAVMAAASAQIQRVNPFGFNQYNPYNTFPNNQYRYNQYSTPSPFRPYVPVSTIAPPVATVAPPVYPSPTPIAPVVPKAGVYQYDARYADTVRYDNVINPDSSYNYYYETSNGIAAQEQGAPRNFGGNPPVAPIVAQGSFSWTSPEGEPIAISYIADENGYQPTGAAIPTPPPIPPQILRALEYIARSAPRK